ncbi:MAG: hypothetical protein SFW09_02985 [Hyphomicrobiaceae bacterium]|nr:hypothetical protein [Hyphomicrobiaceae bacterium]
MYGQARVERLSALGRRWEAARRSVAVADRGAAEAATTEAYRAADLPPPEIVWAEGPSDIARMWEDPALERRAGQSVKAAVVAAPLRAAEDRLAAQLPAVDLRQLRRLVLPYILDRASRGVLEAVMDAPQLAATRLTMLVRGLNLLLRRPRPAWRYSSLVDCGISLHDAPPFHVYELAAELPGLSDITHRLVGLMGVMENAGWLVPFERVAILCERHDVLRVDVIGRLHAGDGPALAWPDGFRHYAWKGVGVPAWMIRQPDMIEVSRIEREPDLTLRHCMVDIFTAERFIRRGYAERVAEDESGVLWQRLWRRGGIWAAVEVVNGTPEPDQTFKRYYLQVPGNLRSARQAVAWTYGLTEHEYRRLRLRT